MEIRLLSCLVELSLVVTAMSTEDNYLLLFNYLYDFFFSEKFICLYCTSVCSHGKISVSKNVRNLYYVCVCFWPNRLGCVRCVNM